MKKGLSVLVDKLFNDDRLLDMCSDTVLTTYTGLLNGFTEETALDFVEMVKNYRMKQVYDVQPIITEFEPYYNKPKSILLRQVA